MSLDQLADRINTVSRLTGTFTLRSGQIATEYFDKYRFEALPDLLGEIADAMVPLIPMGTEVLAGLEMGGIPIATALRHDIDSDASANHLGDWNLVQRLFPSREMNRCINVSPAMLRQFHPVRSIVVPARCVLCMLNDELEILFRRPDNRIRSKRMG